MEKVYTLPDLPFAPYSDVQALVRRLIEYADLTTLRPLADELRGQNRMELLDGLANAFGDDASRCTMHEDFRLRWKYTVQWLLNRFWVELFGWDGVITALKDKIQHVDDEVYEEANPPIMAQNASLAFRVTHNLTAGNWVVRDYTAMTLRPATPEEIAAAEPTEEAVE